MAGTEASKDPVSLRSQPATVVPATPPPTTADTAATAIAICTEKANPTAGTAADAINVEPVLTDKAAFFAPCNAMNSVINLLDYYEVSKNVRDIAIKA